MNKSQDKTLAAAQAQRIVYVREADPSTLPEHLRQVPNKLYAIHDLAGNQIALAPDRRLAFALAVRNDLTPLSVH
ncbi:MAG: DUF1150 family protein [Pseudomonadota bacterium]